MVLLGIEVEAWLVEILVQIRLQRRFFVQSGGSQIAVKRNSGGDIPIKRSELNVKSAQDIVAGVNPTMEGSLSRIQTSSK